ncbi:hypothetical protein BCR36DRAFT_372683 [Piromyces finnis]|uniref:Uncharacterized protein n=1 Tax=Piromyces finnis TaxID=1754191 RepID=A0A1Y1V2B3_9FUNG|nr:hypothetical protein BCR36DRAFT_372683 [Piromyces finnis]|eukprot:ORX45628.1 hypothetical protein BCR36DRAFT_372683 [Piromyces finnis]
MNNLEYCKNKKDSEVIKYLKEYNLYYEGRFDVEDIKFLICSILKPRNYEESDIIRKEILEKDNDKNTALYYTVRGFKEKAIDCLLKNNFDVNMQNTNGNTPLHMACKDISGNGEMIQYLVE